MPSEDDAGSANAVREFRYTTAVQQRMEGELSAARSNPDAACSRSAFRISRPQEVDLYAVVEPGAGRSFYDYFIDRDGLACSSETSRGQSGGSFSWPVSER